MICSPKHYYRILTLVLVRLALNLYANTNYVTMVARGSVKRTSSIIYGFAASWLPRSICQN